VEPKSSQKNRGEENEIPALHKVSQESFYPVVSVGVDLFL